jgi:hypothetical protein
MAGHHKLAADYKPFIALPHLNQSNTVRNTSSTGMSAKHINTVHAKTKSARILPPKVYKAGQNLQYTAGALQQATWFGF